MKQEKSEKSMNEFTGSGSDQDGKVLNIKDNNFKFSVRAEGTYLGHKYGNAFVISGPAKVSKETGLHKMEISFLTLVRFLKWANDPDNKAEVMKYYNIEKDKIVLEDGY